VQKCLLHVAVVTRPLKAVKFTDTSKLICPSRSRGTAAPSLPAQKPEPNKQKQRQPAFAEGDSCSPLLRRSHTWIAREIASKLLNVLDGIRALFIIRCRALPTNITGGYT
jgi:hypothetical protein